MPSILNQPGAEPREIVGVGIVTEAGIPLERAAESMNELRNDSGPLTGPALVTAATEWAEAAGFTIGEPTTPAKADSPPTPPVEIAPKPVVAPVTPEPPTVPETAPGAPIATPTTEELA